MENTRANYEGSLDLGFWSINAQTDVTDWNTPVQGITDVELEQAGVALSPMETPMSEYKGVDRAINLIIDELYAARFARDQAMRDMVNCQERNTDLVERLGKLKDDIVAQDAHRMVLENRIADMAPQKQFVVVEPHITPGGRKVQRKVKVQSISSVAGVTTILIAPAT
jgi:hypothetical protein